MGIILREASDQYLSIDQNLINSPVWSYSVWVFVVNRFEDGVILWSGDKDLETTYHSIRVEEFNGEVTNRARTPAASGTGDTLTPAPLGGWAHVFGEFASTTSRTGWLNGLRGLENTTSVTTDINAVTDRFVIGARRSSVTTGDFYGGVVAEVAVWDVAGFPPDQIYALAQGFPVEFVRKQNLVRYFPLNHIKDLTCRISGVALTPTNGPQSGPHPPLKRYEREFGIEVPIPVTVKRKRTPHTRRPTKGTPISG